LIKRKFY